MAELNRQERQEYFCEPFSAASLVLRTTILPHYNSQSRFRVAFASFICSGVQHGQGTDSHSELYIALEVGGPGVQT